MKKKARGTEHRRAETSGGREWRCSKVPKAGDELAGFDLFLIFDGRANTAVCFPLCCLFFVVVVVVFDQTWCFMHFSLMHDFVQFFKISEKGEKDEWVDRYGVDIKRIRKATWCCRKCPEECNVPLALSLPSSTEAAPRRWPAKHPWGGGGEHPGKFPARTYLPTKLLPPPSQLGNPFGFFSPRAGPAQGGEGAWISRIPEPCALIAGYRLKESHCAQLETGQSRGEGETELIVQMFPHPPSRNSPGGIFPAACSRLAGPDLQLFVDGLPGSGIPWLSLVLFE